MARITENCSCIFGVPYFLYIKKAANLWLPTVDSPDHVKLVSAMSGNLSEVAGWL